MISAMSQPPAENDPWADLEPADKDAFAREILEAGFRRAIRARRRGCAEGHEIAEAILQSAEAAADRVRGRKLP